MVGVYRPPDGDVTIYGGSVYRQGGRADVGATVIVRGPGGEMIAHATTDANGRWQIRLPLKYIDWTRIKRIAWIEITPSARGRLAGYSPVRRRAVGGTDIRITLPQSGPAGGTRGYRADNPPRPRPIMVTEGDIWEEWYESGDPDWEQRFADEMKRRARH